MTPFLRFEWFKLTRRWMPRVLLLLVLTLLSFAFLGQSSRNADITDFLMPRSWLAALIFCSFFAPFFWPVLGGSWAGNEYGWGTIRMILTRRPYRIQHLAASLLVLLAGLILALLAVVVVATVLSLLVSAFRGTSQAPGVFSGSFLWIAVKTFAAAWYVAGFYLVLAFTAAHIFESVAVGIAVGIGSTFAELILRELFRGLGGVWNTIAEHFPVVYTQDLATQVAAPGLRSGSGLASVGPGTPGVAESMIALAVYMAVLMTITALVAQRRDITS